jgi:hypothetical protein
MAGFGDGTGVHRRWLVTLSLAAALAAIVFGVLLWNAVELSSLAAVSERVEKTKPLMSALRLALIGLLAVVWPWLSLRGVRLCAATETARGWMALRWRVVGWLLAIELIVGLNLFGRLISVVAHTA